MPIALLDPLATALLATAHIAAEGSALFFGLAIAGAVYVMSAVSYRG